MVAALIADPRVRTVNFTGSTNVGRIIGVQEAQHLKPAVLELGGKNPLIILEDADRDLAVDAAVFGAFMNSGQICMSTDRIIIHKSLVERFIPRYVERVKALPVGDPARRRKARRLGKPETFDFLGFTHICGKTKDGRFGLRRYTISKRMRAKLHEVREELWRRRRHLSVPEQGRWLGSVVRGHCAYYAVPGNSKAIRAFRDQVTRHWHRALRRRSQRTRLNWERMDRLADRWLPPARIMHPWPSVRFDARTRGRSPVR